jgi:hypothetical protein
MEARYIVGNHRHTTKAHHRRMEDPQAPVVIAVLVTTMAQEGSVVQVVQVVTILLKAAMVITGVLMGVTTVINPVPILGRFGGGNLVNNTMGLSRIANLKIGWCVAVCR